MNVTLLRRRRLAARLRRAVERLIAPWRLALPAGARDGR